MRLRLIPKLDADVIVAGAGPAGATVALQLARTGVDVLLVDRERFPRDKVCGDFVGPVALRVLERLGLGDDLQSQAPNLIKDAALFLDGNHLLTSPFPQFADLPPFGTTLPRLALDEVTFRAATRAGVRVIEEHAVVAYDVEPDVIRVLVRGKGGTSSLTARLLVGADGSSSTIAAILRGARSARADRIIAVRAYYEGVSGPSDRADLYFTELSFPGYCWVFPTSATSANVGVGMVLETIPPTTEHLRDTLLHLVETDAALRRRLSDAHLVGKIVGWPLATYNARLPITADRVILIGDAAGLINPLNGEGIQYALQSAGWAAEVISSCLRSGDASRAGLAPYADRVAVELTYDMALARLLVRAISNRTLNPIWLRALRAIASRARHDPEYGWVTGAVLAGLAPARDVLSLRVISGTVEEGVANLLLDSFIEVLRGPARVRADVRASALTISQIAYENLRRPLATTKWAVDVGIAAAELLAEASKALIAGRRNQNSRSTM